MQVVQLQLSYLILEMGVLGGERRVFLFKSLDALFHIEEVICVKKKFLGVLGRAVGSKTGKCIFDHWLWTQIFEKG